MLNLYGHNDQDNDCPLDTMLNLEKKLCSRPEIVSTRKLHSTLTPFTHNAKSVDVHKLTATDQIPDKTSPVIVQFNRLVTSYFTSNSRDNSPYKSSSIQLPDSKVQH